MDILKTHVPAGSNRYYALCFADKTARKNLSALLALYDEITLIPSRCSEASVAEAKLNWWQCEIDALFSEKSQHPIIKVLQTALPDQALSKSYFYALVSGAQMQLLFTRVRTRLLRKVPRSLTMRAKPRQQRLS